MKVSPLNLTGAWLIETEAFQDQRGKFARFFCQKELGKIHKGKPIEQINYSWTVPKGTVRGLHFQCPPKTETKLVRCLRGSVFDVIVDLRSDSETFLQWHGEILSDENMRMLYVPDGFAHGFQAQEENVEMLYMHTESYNPEYEGGVRYDDPRLCIQWPLAVTEVSDRDRSHPLLTGEFEGLVL